MLFIQQKQRQTTARVCDFGRAWKPSPTVWDAKRYVAERHTLRFFACRRGRWFSTHRAAGGILQADNRKGLRFREGMEALPYGLGYEAVCRRAPYPTLWVGWWDALRFYSVSAQKNRPTQGRAVKMVIT